VHLAMDYAEDNRIIVYSNGQRYGESYVPANSTLRTYPAKSSHILFGQRHSSGGNAFLAGEIEEARLYDRALSAEEVTASFRAGVESVPLEAILRVMTPEQRRQREELFAEAGRKRQRIPSFEPSPLA